MRTRDMINGLTILKGYYNNLEGFHLATEHGVLSAEATDKPLTRSDLVAMITMGWHQEYNERDYCEDFGTEHYKEDEAWVAYT